MKKKNSSDRSWENWCVNVTCATFISLNCFTGNKNKSNFSTSLVIRIIEKEIFHMYICSYMKWIAFVQIIYRTLAVYQEKNLKMYWLTIIRIKMIISNGLQCRVSLPSKLVFTVVVQKGWKLMVKQRKENPKKEKKSTLSGLPVSTGGCHCCHGYKITNIY